MKRVYQITTPNWMTTSEHHLSLIRNKPRHMKKAVLFLLFLSLLSLQVVSKPYSSSNFTGSSVYVFDNIKQLQSSNEFQSNNSILYRVLGYYKAGDGGGGSFYFEEDPKEIPNGGTIIRSNTNPKGVFKRLYSESVNVLWFGVKRNSFEDQADLLNKVMTYAHTSGDAVFMPNGMYFVKSTINIYDGIELSGENMKKTILRCDVPGDFAVLENKSSPYSNGDRTSLKSFTINTLSRYGLQYTTDQKHYSFTASFERIEVIATRKGAHDLSVAIRIEGLSHAYFDTIICSSKGTAFEIAGDKFNTGVMTFNNCFFGHKFINRVGFHFTNGKALDSYTFNSCFFAATHVPELIGNGNNTVVGATHNACHYENMMGKSDDKVGSAFIQFNLNNFNESGYGALGFSWNNCTLGGNQTIETAIKFNKGHYKGITFTGTRIVNTGKAPDFYFDKEAFFTDCEINGLFSQSQSDETITDKTVVWENKQGITYGWNILNNGYYNLQHNIKKDPRYIRIIDKVSNIPTDVHYNKGDIYYNSNPGKRKYIGWICVKSGTPGEWRRFGKIK